MDRHQSPLRTYVGPIVLSACFVLLSPVGFLTVFLSGDDCCGGNTSGTMIGVTVTLVVLLTAVSFALCAGMKASRRGQGPPFSVLLATAVAAGPAALLHTAFVTWLVLSAF